MAYDEHLAERIRALLGVESGVQEKEMFGSLGFLIGGNVAIAASGQGGVLVRVAPDQADDIVTTSKAEPAIMRGRPLAGWLRVAAEHVSTTRELERWVNLGAARARALPAKTQG